MVRASIIVVVVSLVIFFGYKSIVPAATPAKHPELEPESVQNAAKILRTVVESKEMSVADAKKRLSEAIQSLEEDHYAVGMLEPALNEVDFSGLQSTAKQIHESLTFRPMLESKLPVGFPNFTPVHKIEVKTLPMYRMAKAEMKSNSNERNNPFWSLFQHIKRNDIAMTAPVQMDYKKDQKNEASMAFLYRNTELGSLGEDPKDGSVEIIEVPEHQVVSIGVRGRMNETKVQAAKVKLEKWLKANPEFKAKGPLRKMGYNSPFMPNSRAYFEVQFPVEKVDVETLPDI